jgi:hypothetical protein
VQTGDEDPEQTEQAERQERVVDPQAAARIGEHDERMFDRTGVLAQGARALQTHNGIRGLRQDVSTRWGKRTGVVPKGVTTGVVPNGVNTGIVPRGVTTGVLPEGVTTGVLPEGVTTGVLPEGVTTGVLPEGVTTGVLPQGVTTGVLPEGVTTGVLPEGVTTGCLPRGVTTGFLPRGVTTGVLPEGVTTGVLPEGVTTGVLPEGVTTGCLPEGVTTGCLPRGVTTGCLPRGVTMVVVVLIAIGVSLVSGCLADPQRAQASDLLDRLTLARTSLAQPEPTAAACNDLGDIETRLYGEPGLTEVQPAWSELADAAHALQAICGQDALLAQPISGSAALQAARERWRAGQQREIGVACDHLRAAATALSRDAPC